MVRTLILSSILMSSSAFAEYRVFELRITNDTNGKERIVSSTFDHIQYSEYHPVDQGERVEYIQSWMCWDRTNGRPYCPNPYLGRSPAANP